MSSRWLTIAAVAIVVAVIVWQAGDAFEGCGCQERKARLKAWLNGG